MPGIINIKCVGIHGGERIKEVDVKDKYCWIQSGRMPNLIPKEEPERLSSAFLPVTFF